MSSSTREIYIRLAKFADSSGITLDPATAGEYDYVSQAFFNIYTSASDLLAANTAAGAGYRDTTTGEDIRESTRNSGSGPRYSSAYTSPDELSYYQSNTDLDLQSVYPSGGNSSSDGVGVEAYEIYIYNHTGKNIYYSTTQNDGESNWSGPVSSGNWVVNDPSSQDGFSPFENFYLGFRHDAPYFSNNRCLTINKLYKNLYLYITGISGKTTTTPYVTGYQLFSSNDSPTGVFTGLLSTVTGLTSAQSLNLENTWYPAHWDSSAAYYTTSTQNPDQMKVYVHNANYTGLLDGTATNYAWVHYTDYDGRTGNLYPVRFTVESSITVSSSDGTTAGTGSVYSDNLSSGGSYPTEFKWYPTDSSDTDYYDSYGYPYVSDTDPTNRWDSLTSLLTVTEICFPPFTLIETPNGLTQIVDLKVGDEVKTQRGIVKVSKNMTTHTPGGATFVFFPKDCICEGFPSEDAYITEFHPIAIKNVEEDNKDVMHFIEARHFINKFKGIELKKLDTKTYHNLVFDTVEIFNVGGMKMCSHHPNNTPIKLRKEEFLGEVNEREPVNLYYTFEKLLEDKKEEEDLGEFIKNIFIYN